MRKYYRKPYKRPSQPVYNIIINKQAANYYAKDVEIVIQRLKINLSNIVVNYSFFCHFGNVPLYNSRTLPIGKKIFYLTKAGQDLYFELCRRI